MKYLFILFSFITTHIIAQENSIIDEFNDAEEFIYNVEKHAGFCNDYIRKAQNETDLGEKNIMLKKLKQKQNIVKNKASMQVMRFTMLLKT
ncbi:MAG: hypothetical protein LRY27_03950 [Chitinophagales bacterium]|nr:hypothetical protein [Chitinophagales bacterium]